MACALRWATGGLPLHGLLGVIFAGSCLALARHCMAGRLECEHFALAVCMENGARRSELHEL